MEAACHSGATASRALTAQVSDGDDVGLVALMQIEPPHEHEQVPGDGDGRHDPDADPEHRIGEQVSDRRQSVALGATVAHVRRVLALVEGREPSAQ